MPKQNFKSHAKRKRELAKLDKRQAKDQKRALQRAQQTDAGGTLAPAVAPVAPSGVRAAPGVPGVPGVVAQKPLTLAEAVERWKNTRIVKARPR